ncbi:hypothetical protein BU25DRAFT_418027 [Macroventuria anomochaeta]|uniref:Uncharacterized protein n=1 Tax=Macroventuria anomochaeta TaxID=301207 RepID=A0ACB6SGU8_9PLEO|nr:uncharacterized protein BU25DRAFT_418027 [Macroventuria anomochaeta]KAF2632317.1 hypothetical protein BU25DRAFT_418027 [Macroventuria anomochaeta]
MASKDVHRRSPTCSASPRACRNWRGLVPKTGVRLTAHLREGFKCRGISLKRCGISVRHAIVRCGRLLQVDNNGQMSDCGGYIACKSGFVTLFLTGLTSLMTVYYVCKIRIASFTRSGDEVRGTDSLARVMSWLEDDEDKCCEMSLLDMYTINHRG